MRPHVVDVEVIRADGARETVHLNRAGLLRAIERTIGADVTDSVNLRDGRVMLVDDLGHPKCLPINAPATALYHSICRPGTTHTIRGDVAVVLDEHFA